MFKSRYIFETRRTRLLRYTRNTFIASSLLFLFYSLLCTFFLFISENEKQRVHEYFFKRTPDLFVVFTGDAGRIPYTIEMAKKFNQPHIFITGVYTENSVETLITPLKEQYSLDPNLLNIDYLAKNTVENAISTLRYLRGQKAIRNVIIITHDYHIMRTKLVMEKVLSLEDDYRFYYLGVESDYSNWKNIKKLLREGYKYIRTYLFLLVWNIE